MTERLLTYKDICGMLNRNYKTIWSWVKKGTFPQPVRYQGRTIGWKQKDINEWIDKNYG